MSPTVAAIFGPLVLVLGIAWIVRRRRKALKLKDPHRTLKFYDRQMAQYAELRAEVLEERQARHLAEREARQLRNRLTAQDAAHASESRIAARCADRLQARLDSRASEKEAKALREKAKAVGREHSKEVKHLCARFNDKWEEVDELKRELRRLRNEDDAGHSYTDLFIPGSNGARIVEL
jgi:hypothetical protein